MDISICTSAHYRYREFRDESGELTIFYWQLLCIRLGFVIVFEVSLLSFLRTTLTLKLLCCTYVKCIKLNAYCIFSPCTVPTVTFLPSGCFLPSPVACIQMRFNTTTFYGKIETFEAVHVQLWPCLVTADCPCSAAISRDNATVRTDV